VEDRNNPVFCEHVSDLDDGQSLHIVQMDRVVSRFLFNADLEKDRPENQLGRILTKSNSRQDWHEALKKDYEKAEKDREGWDMTPTKEVTMDDIDIHGAWTAAHAGPDQLQRWRNDNIKQDDFATSSVSDA
jgi:hypothetical protein